MDPLKDSELLSEKACKVPRKPCLSRFRHLSSIARLAACRTSESSPNNPPPSYDLPADTHHLVLARTSTWIGVCCTFCSSPRC